jgi:uncharacterized SAM-binding protein YcdF (DUF218 family)
MRTLSAILIAAIVWISGLMAFVARAVQFAPTEPPPSADAVVALTGASTDRLTTAIQLVEQGKAARVLVSGVNRSVTRDELLAVTRSVKPIYDCCVDLGFSAEDTIGNARETAEWARTKGYRSLIIVTADYHMARAMLELTSTMPTLKLTAYAVPTPELALSDWWRRPGASRICLEYNKYLAVLARETFYKLGDKLESRKASPAG